MTKPLLIFFFVLPLFCFAQVKNIGIPQIQNYTKSVYNAGTQNWGIAQDKNGFMYFGNNSGLLKFDGFHWELIEVPQAMVRSVLVDSQGRIFVGLLNDFGVIENDETGNYTYKSLLNFVSDEKRASNDIWKIHEIDNNIIFQSFEKLFIYNGHEIKIIEPTNQFRFSFNVNGRLFIQERGLGLFEIYNNRLERVPWAGMLRDKEILTVLETGENSLLIGTANNGFYFYDHGRLTAWKTEVNDFVLTNQLFCASRISGNYLAFGTVLNGLVIADMDGKIILHMNRKRGLQNNTILSVFSDKEKNLWLGLDNGIGYVEINSSVNYITDQGGIGTGYCCEFFDDKLYVGTNQGLFVKPFNSLQTNNENFQLVKNTGGQVWSLNIYAGQLICGHNYGTFVVEGNNATKINDEPGAWEYIQLQNHPDWLLGGHYKGLLILKNGKNGWEFRNKIKGFEESSRFLQQADNGMVWMSHGGKGIYRIVLNENADSVITSKLYGQKHGLPSDKQNILFNLKDRNYISTTKGVYEYSSFSDSFLVADEVNKLFGINERIKTVETDDAGNIWYISQNESGVLRQNADLTYTKITAPFKTLNGKFVNEFEFLYPYQNNHILLGIDNGFAHYSSNFPKSYSSSFNSFITKIELNYLDSVIYPKSQPAGDLFEFPFRKNNFRFHFTSPFYENLSNLRFSYFLENYSEDWSDWAGDNYKDFTNLFEGEYTFKVKALNVYGVESEVSEFKFTITPPLHRSNVALYIYIVLILVLLFLIVRFIRYRIERSKKREKQKHHEKLRKQEEEFQHQAVVAEKKIIKLRNDKLRAEKIHRDKELANQTMVVIKKNKLLLKLNEELKRIQSSTTDSTIITKVVLMKKRIKRELDDKQQNKLFETYFEDVHANFFNRIKEKYPQLSPNDLRLCAYIRMNISTKEIATLLNISIRGVEISRYRLRKKLEIPREINLSTFLLNI